jgi:hypothetical protein
MVIPTCEKTPYPGTGFITTTKTSVLEDTLSRSPRVLRIGATVIEVLPLSAGPMGSRSARSPSPHLGSK